MKRFFMVVVLLAVALSAGKGVLATENIELFLDAQCEKQIVITMVKGSALGLAELLKSIPEEKERIQAIQRFIVSIRFYADESGYFYVYDLACVNIAHATQPELQGNNLYDYQDTKGKYVIRGLAEKAKSGGGFVDYYWQNPNTGKEERKIGYVEMIPDTNYFIGSGLYLSNPPNLCSEFPIEDYQHEETRQLIQFVNAAAKEIESYGELTFPQFGEKNSRWLDDESYIFVSGMDGMRYVYPPDVSLEGTNMLDLEDTDGRAIGKMFVDVAASPSGEGWVHYRWSKQEENAPTWKSSFVKRVASPSGKSYLVGSGKYNLECEKIFVIDMVNRAISILEKEGSRGLETLHSRANEFIFAEMYIFVKDTQGNELLNIAFPELEGTNLIDLKDYQGKYFVREVLNILKFEDDCWIEYMWPKPGKSYPSTKLAYEKKVVVDNHTFIVGIGYYLD